MKCKKCQTVVDKNVTICPMCGSTVIDTNKISKSTIYIIGISLLAIALVAAFYILAKNNSTKEQYAREHRVASAQQNPPYNIGIKIPELKRRWNMFEKNDIKRNLQMGELIFQAYDVQDVYGYRFDPTLFMAITVNKADGYVRNVVVFGIPTKDEEKNSNIFYAFLLMTKIANPELTEPQRKELVVKLLGTSEDRSNLNTVAQCGNNMYTAQFDKKKGFMFTVSNILEYKKNKPSIPNNIMAT